MRLIIIALLLTGCMSPQERLQKERDWDLAMKKLIACQAYYAPKLDDGFSNPRVIAYAVTQSCIREYETAMNLFIDLHAENLHQRVTLQERMHTQESMEKYSLKMVLANRKR